MMLHPSSHCVPRHKNNRYINGYVLLFWVIFAFLVPDPEPLTRLNPDPISEWTVPLTEIKGYLQPGQDKDVKHHAPLIIPDYPAL
jgi:hypothetical protein